MGRLSGQYRSTPLAFAGHAKELRCDPGLAAASRDDGDRAAALFPGATAQLAEIRLVLEAFDWEASERQYTLEAIDDIVTRTRM
jgi:hypothetical protein